jgi:hypothetical protein
MAHITNIQSGHPEWTQRKHDGLQSWKTFANELDDSVPGERFVYGRLLRQAKAISSFAFQSCVDKLVHNDSSFELMAVDWTIDATGRLYLLEFNVAPALDSGGPEFSPEWKRKNQYNMSISAVEMALAVFEHRIKNTKSSTVSSSLFQEVVMPYISKSKPKSKPKPTLHMSNWQLLYSEFDNGELEHDAINDLKWNEAMQLGVQLNHSQQHLTQYPNLVNLLSGVKHKLPLDLLDMYVPQGIAAVSRTEWYVSMYSITDGTAILFSSKTNQKYALVDEHGSPWESHVGGIVIVNDILWVCNEGVHVGGRLGELVAFHLPDKEVDTDNLMIQKRLVVDARASFVSLSADGDTVCVGEFAYEGREEDYPIAQHHIIAGAYNNAWVACYATHFFLLAAADDSKNIASNEANQALFSTKGSVMLPEPTMVFLIGDGIQGFLYGPDNNVILSKSFGFGDSQIQYHDLSLHIFIDKNNGKGKPVPVNIGGTMYHTFVVSDASTMTNKIFAPALSQDLSFIVTKVGIELLVLFESGSKKYRDMVKEMGWSSIDQHVYSMRLPKWRHTFTGTQYPLVNAIGFDRPKRTKCGIYDVHWACQHLIGLIGFNRSTTAEQMYVQLPQDQRMVFDAMIDGINRIFTFERNMSSVDAAAEAKFVCAWNRIRDSRCPAAMEQRMVSGGEAYM